MKKVIALMTCISMVFPAVRAQETDQVNNEFKTLFGDGRASHGGYGALSIEYSQINSLDAILIGAEGAWVVGHWFALGLAGKGFLNDYTFNPAINADVNLVGGYGGLLIEPIVLPKFPVHISVPLLIGAGGISYTSTFNPRPYDYEDFELFVEDAAGYFVVEPGIEIEFNVVRFFRLAVGGYYRFTSGVQLHPDLEIPEDVLNGWSVGIKLKFGKF